VSSPSTDARPVVPRGGDGRTVDSLLGDWYRAFWEVMVLAAPVHLWLLLRPTIPLAERTAGVVAYPALVLAVGLLRGGWVTVGREWPSRRLEAGLVRVGVYSAGLAAAFLVGGRLGSPALAAGWALVVAAGTAAAVPYAAARVE
jgi:hypothetical protein